MKKVYQLIATATLSIMTIGAFAQSMSNGSLNEGTAHRAVFNRTKHATNKPTGTMTYSFLDYTYSDSVAAMTLGLEPYNSSPSIGQYYIQDFNGRYVPADTGSPLANQLLIKDAAVAFDTLLDANTGMGYSGNGLVIDSLFIPIGQQNISGKMDTLVIQIVSLGTYGIPTKTVLWTDTIKQDTGLSGKGKSWFYGHTVILAPHYAMTGTAKCAVKLQYLSGSNKRDTCGFLFGSPTYTCTNPSGANPDTTFIGAKITPIHHLIANSFTTGYSYFTTGHKGASITLPDAVNGDFIGYPCTTPKNLSAGPFQDIAMYAEVSFNNTTSVNEVSANGFDVAQNYPNPFSKSTQINYTVTKSSDIVFNVYDLTGRKIMSNSYNEVTPGQHIITLSANQFTPGVYFYTFNVNGNVVTKRMVITE